jgi:hypothetical protein
MVDQLKVVHYMQQLRHGESGGAGGVTIDASFAVEDL